jgi:hypothetical protein
MFKNVANQKIVFYAHDLAANTPKTGDAANLTAYVSKDGGAPVARAATSATELDAVFAKGVYAFDVTAAESNGDVLVFSANSATANVQLDPLIVCTVPANFTLLAIDSNGRLDLGRWLGVAPLALTNQRVDVTVGVLQANVVSATAIASDAITATKLADGSLTAAKFAAGAFDAVWSVATRTLSAAGVQAIWDVLTSGLTTLGSLGKLLVDKLAGVSGQLASQAEVTAIQNNTRAVISLPEVLERPDSGTSLYRIELFLYDDVGNMEVPDAAPTLVLVNQAGTDLSSRLSSTTMSLVSTGRYRVLYTASAGDALEQLNWTFSVIEGGATRAYGRQSVIVDTTAVDFTAADRTALLAIAGNADVPTSTRLATAGYTAPDNATIAAIATKTDVATSTRLAAAGYTAPDNATIAAIASKTDVATSTRLATTGYTAPDNATIAAIHAQTELLPADPASTTAVLTRAAPGAAMTLTTPEREAVADALLDRVDGIEPDETPRQTLRLLRAASVGVSNGFPEGPIHFRDKENTKDRITALTDTQGNRTAIATNPT